VTDTRTDRLEVRDTSRPAGGALEVIRPGTLTTVQDLRGRRGLWGVGVPPSGAWDDLSFALANRAVGNPADAAGLEAVLRGPVVRFDVPALVCVTGAATEATVDGVPLPCGAATHVTAGARLDLGVTRGGLRSYLAVAGGIDVPLALGSRATFLLGGLGGHEGRGLRAGDVLTLGTQGHAGQTGQAAGGGGIDIREALPSLGSPWEVRVLAGPHGTPEHLTAAGVEALLETAWTVDHRSGRTGVRLNGPAPRWARADGGEAGLHPSNIHDSAYPIGGIMLAGSTPVVVGPDGPSLGGFVVPAVVIRADRWVLAQVRPGDTIRLVPVSPQHAAAINDERADLLGRPRARGADRAALPVVPGRRTIATVSRSVPLLDIPAAAGRPALRARRCGDHHLLAEVGPETLDLAVRVRVHLLAQQLATAVPAGIVETVEGVRSVLLAVDEHRLPLETLADRVAEQWELVPDPATVALEVREVELPLAFDDPAAHEAMRRYQRDVRPDAPWCPDNVEFIRRVNGLARREDVFAIVEAASYLVLGLGDVYLGAPVAVPLDPRHRLVTTKYDPARPWTPANAVGIGGIYLCVYGMEGPGGYQLLGRTVPVWRYDPDAAAGTPPWLLRPFDILRFRPVTPGELLRQREDIAFGRADLVTRPATFRLADAERLAGSEEASAFTRRREAAFAAERARWADA